MLASMLGKSTETAAAPADVPPPEPTPATDPLSGPSLSPLVAMLPQLMQAFSGQGNLLSNERVNLLKAMRPYLKETRLGSIDRALKMANVTKAATSAMHLLGR